MWHSQQYRQLVRASAAYDLIVTAAFATPWTFALEHAGLSWLATSLALPGSFPAFDVVHVLMANLLGSLVCVWALIRLRDPRMAYGRYDAIARGLFALWQTYALLHGASAIIAGFLLAELAFGVAQALPVRARTADITRCVSG